MKHIATMAFKVALNKITTTIDGGWRITFDASQSERENIMKLSEHRDEELLIGIVTQTPENRMNTDA